MEKNWMKGQKSIFPLFYFHASATKDYFCFPTPKSLGDMINKVIDTDEEIDVKVLGYDERLDSEGSSVMEIKNRILSCFICEDKIKAGGITEGLNRLIVGSDPDRRAMFIIPAPFALESVEFLTKTDKVNRIIVCLVGESQRNILKDGINGDLFMTIANRVTDNIDQNGPLKRAPIHTILSCEVLDNIEEHGLDVSKWDEWICEGVNKTFVTGSFQIVMAEEYTKAFRLYYGNKISFDDLEDVSKETGTMLGGLGCNE